jgi:ABC-2 type transport system permease protein/capsular polysaccharide transport system permease protein
MSATPANALWRSVGLQRRVIKALLLREILTRYGRKNIGFLWMFAEPMMFILAITALWSATRAMTISNLPIVAFALTGYSSMILWRNMPGRLIGALKTNQSLLYHRQVRILDVYIARVLLEIAASTSAFVILAIAFWSIGWVEAPEDVLKVIGGWALLAWFGAALGFILGGLSERYDMIEKFYPPISYLMFPLSGAGFIADAVPEKVRNIVLYLPQLNCVEYLREGYFGSKIVAHYDLSYVTWVNAVMTIMALAIVRRIGVENEEE